MLASEMHAFLLGCSRALLLPAVWAALAWNSLYPTKVLWLLGCHQHRSPSNSCCCSNSPAATAERPPLCPGRVVPLQSCPYSAPPTAPQAAQWKWAGKMVCWALTPFLIGLFSNPPAVHSGFLSPFSTRLNRSYPSSLCETLAGCIPHAGHILFTTKTSAPLLVDTGLTFIFHSLDAQVTFVISARGSSYLYRNPPNLCKAVFFPGPHPPPGFLRKHSILKNKRIVASPKMKPDFENICITGSQ